MNRFLSAAAFSLIFFANNPYVHADVCKSKDQELPLMNAQVLEWKASADVANQQKERAHVNGRIVRIYPEKNGHAHFAIDLKSDEKNLCATDINASEAALDKEIANDGKVAEGKDNEDLEVIYQQNFGHLPELKVCDQIEACGDFIKSTAPTDKEVASPDGAIIHWVHQSNSKNHDSGFVIVNGQRFGDLKGGGGHGKKSKGGGSSGALAITQIPFKDPATCFKLSNTHVILNPNYNVKGQAFSHYYGFLYDGKNIYKVSDEKDTTAVKGAEFSSFADFYQNQLGHKIVNGCPAPDQNDAPPAKQPETQPAQTAQQPANQPAQSAAPVPAGPPAPAQSVDSYSECKNGAKNECAP